MAEVPGVLPRKGVIGPRFAFDLAVDGQLVAFQNPYHFPDGDLCVQPIFAFTAFLQTQLRVEGSHAMFSH
jgi:hypothetical protein